MSQAVSPQHGEENPGRVRQGHPWVEALLTEGAELQELGEAELHQRLKVGGWPQLGICEVN